MGAVAGVRGGVAPAGVAGYHEGFQTGDGARHDDVVFVDLGPDACQDGGEGGVGGLELDVEVVEAEDNKDNCSVLPQIFRSKKGKKRGEGNQKGRKG